MNKILFILCLTSASLWMLSCTDYEVASYPEENETEVFNGTVLDYLSTGNERLNLKFDSMMVLVNNIPDFIQQMEQTDVQYTVFAIPDACIRSSLAQLNEYRKQKELGEAIYLSDLLIEPFVVKDTIVNVVTPTLMIRSLTNIITIMELTLSECYASTLLKVVTIPIIF